jgi:hypothetical protein
MFVFSWSLEIGATLPIFTLYLWEILPKRTSCQLTLPVSEPPFWGMTIYKTSLTKSVYFKLCHQIRITVSQPTTSLKHNCSCGPSIVSSLSECLYSTTLLKNHIRTVSLALCVPTVSVVPIYCHWAVDQYHIQCNSVCFTLRLLCSAARYDMIYIFVNCNWVVTRWQ